MTDKEPITHNKKTVQPYYGRLMDGTKTFELRNNGKAYQVGDTFRAEEYCPHVGYSGGYLEYEIVGIDSISELIEQFPDAEVILSLRPKTLTQHTTTLQAQLSDKDKEIERLKDNPEFDGTDAAHPAWWRGHDSSCKEFCHLVNEILDGKDDDAGVASEPWESTKRRIRGLKQQPVLPTKSAAPGTLMGINSPATPSHSAEAKLAVIREDLKKIETALEGYEGPGSCWIKFKIKNALTATAEQVSSYRASLLAQGREQGVRDCIDAAPHAEDCEFVWHNGEVVCNCWKWGALQSLQQNNQGGV